MARSKDKTPRAAGNLVEPSPKQPFSKVRDGGSTEHGTHPLMQTHSRIEELLSNFDKRKAGEELVIEQIEEWKAALNGMAGTPNGQIFLRVMIKASGLFTPGSSGQTVRSVEEKNRADFYLRHVRPYLDKAHRSEIE